MRGKHNRDARETWSSDLPHFGRLGPEEEEEEAASPFISFWCKETKERERERKRDFISISCSYFISYTIFHACITLTIVPTNMLECIPG